MKDPQIILSIVVAGATVAYTIINALMLCESKKARKQKNSPLLIAFLDYPDDNSNLRVHIKNIGEGCAIDVKVNVLKDYNQWGKSNFPLSENRMFKNGINVFPPQYEQIYFLEAANNVDDKSPDSVIELEVEYKPLTGGRIMKKVYNLPFNQIGGNYAKPPTSFMGQIPYYLKEQNTILGQIKSALPKKINFDINSE